MEQPLSGELLAACVDRMLEAQADSEAYVYYPELDQLGRELRDRPTCVLADPNFPRVALELTELADGSYQAAYFRPENTNGFPLGEFVAVEDGSRPGAGVENIVFHISAGEVTLAADVDGEIKSFLPKPEVALLVSDGLKRNPLQLALPTESKQPLSARQTDCAPKPTLAESEGRVIIFRTRAELAREAVDGVFRHLDDKKELESQNGATMESVTQEVTVPLDREGRVILANRSNRVGKLSARLTISRRPADTEAEITGEDAYNLELESKSGLFDIPGITDSPAFNMPKGAKKIGLQITADNAVSIWLEGAKGQQVFLEQPEENADASSLLSALTEALNKKISDAIEAS